MTDSRSAAPDAAGTLDVSGTLKRQYHAGLQMLRQAVEPCPDGLWLSDEHPNQFWHVAYHVLHYTHLYLQHHTGQLADRLRRTADRGVDWVSSAAAGSLD